MISLQPAVTNAGKTLRPYPEHSVQTEPSCLSGWYSPHLGPFQLFLSDFFAHQQVVQNESCASKALGLVIFTRFLWSYLTITEHQLQEARIVVGRYRKAYLRQDGKEALSISTGLQPIRSDCDIYFEKQKHLLSTKISERHILTFQKMRFRQRKLSRRNCWDRKYGLVNTRVLSNDYLRMSYKGDFERPKNE